MEFCSSLGVTNRKSSPTYPQSNGFAERNVQTAKNLLHKCKRTGQNWTTALLHHRNTPVNCGLPSPAELACGRKLRCDLPAYDNVEKYVPHKVDIRALENALVTRREEASRRYNRNTEPLEPLTNEPVW